jgi:hypothetical protein
MKKPRPKEAPTATAPEIDYDEYDKAVEEALEILKQIDSHWMRLAELADQVKTKYGEKKLQNFAQEIGIAFCTVCRHRDVYHAWRDEICAPGRNFPKLGYAVARELATHPDKAKIVTENPNITKREASAKRRAYHKSVSAPGRSAPKDALPPWWCSLLLRARKAITLAQVEDWVDQGISDIPFDPGQVKVIRKAAEDWTRVADCVEQIEKARREPPDVADAPALQGELV